MNLRVVSAIFRKDALSLWPLVTLVALLYFGDAVLTRLDLLPVWSMYGAAVLLVALMVLTLSVFQQDSPASLTDDWLSRPLRIRELLAAKFALLLSAVFLARALGVLVTDLALGLPVSAALQDAFLLPEKQFAFMLLFFLFAAILTRTFVQGFGVLFVIFICVFALPTPFVRPPGPVSPGIRDELLVKGQHWLAVVPAQLAATALVALGFWLVYKRRQLKAARVLMAVTVLVTLFLFVLPMGLASWTTTFAAQKASGPQMTRELAADIERIRLRPLRACFTAARREELATDGAFTSAARGLRLWDSEELAGVGPDAVAFVTAFGAQGLPSDGRVKLNYVQADYSEGGVTRYSLRPASYVTDQHGGDSLRHAWMLPGGAAEELREAGTALALRYSLTLLKPREHSLRVDGDWHELSDLGVCRASPGPGNRIDVECFSAFPTYAQLSAELYRIAATRVYSPPDFTPGWARWPYSERVKLTLAASRLSQADHITVTAWETAAFFDKAITLPGILGADAATCPLPGNGGSAIARSRWRDAAPHEANSITVDDGVQLEVLDFGGSGPPIVLLPGLGATAHSYDDIAPPLARNHRVIAITRRGTGYSSRPDFGFDTPRLSRDVLAVMDQMNLQKALLVGHSIAGEELTWLGGNHGERFTGLVYLDAAFDRAGERDDPAGKRIHELQRLLPPAPPIPAEALLNYEAMSEFLARRGNLRPPEGELIAFLNVDKPHLAGTPNLDGRMPEALLAAIQSPDYAKVKIPALAVYAFRDPDEPLPSWYDRGDERLMANVAELRQLDETRRLVHLEAFRRGVAKGRVLEMPKARHYMLQSNPREVIDAIEGFSRELAAP